MSDAHSHAGKLLKAPLDLFGGTDGGVGFAKLRHSIIPAWIVQAEAGDENSAEMILVIERFSKLCELMMKD